MDKRSVTIEFYNHAGEQKYVGRCIGLLTDVEFNALVNKPDVQQKLMTVRSVLLSDIALVQDIQNLRLAIVTEIGSKNTKGFFITEPIEMISQYVEPDDLTLIGTEGSYITVTEETKIV